MATAGILQHQHPPSHQQAAADCLVLLAGMVKRSSMCASYYVVATCLTILKETETLDAVTFEIHVLFGVPITWEAFFQDRGCSSLLSRIQKGTFTRNDAKSRLFRKQSPAEHRA